MYAARMFKAFPRLPVSRLICTSVGRSTRTRPRRSPSHPLPRPNAIHTTSGRPTLARSISSATSGRCSSSATSPAGPRRFVELQRMLPGISTEQLRSRLNRMVADGLLTRQRYREVPPRVDYELTERSRELMPVLGALARWGYDWSWTGRAAARPSTSAPSSGLRRGSSRCRDRCAARSSSPSRVARRTGRPVSTCSSSSAATSRCMRSAAADADAHVEQDRNGRGSTRSSRRAPRRAWRIRGDAAARRRGARGTASRSAGAGRARRAASRRAAERGDDAQRARAARSRSHPRSPRSVMPRTSQHA